MVELLHFEYEVIIERTSGHGRGRIHIGMDKTPYLTIRKEIYEQLLQLGIDLKKKEFFDVKSTLVFDTDHKAFKILFEFLPVLSAKDVAMRYAEQSPKQPVTTEELHVTTPTKYYDIKKTDKSKDSVVKL